APPGRLRRRLYAHADPRGQSRQAPAGADPLPAARGPRHRARHRAGVPRALSAQVRYRAARGLHPRARPARGAPGSGGRPNGSGSAQVDERVEADGVLPALGLEDDQTVGEFRVRAIEAETVVIGADAPARAPVREKVRAQAHEVGKLAFRIQRHVEVLGRLVGVEEILHPRARAVAHASARRREPRTAEQVKDGPMLFHAEHAAAPRDVALPAVDARAAEELERGTGYEPAGEQPLDEGAPVVGVGLEGNANAGEIARLPVVIDAAEVDAAAQLERVAPGRVERRAQHPPEPPPRAGFLEQARAGVVVLAPAKMLDAQLEREVARGGRGRQRQVQQQERTSGEHPARFHRLPPGGFLALWRTSRVVAGAYCALSTPRYIRIWQVNS